MIGAGAESGVGDDILVGDDDVVCLESLDDVLDEDWRRLLLGNVVALNVPEAE